MFETRAKVFTILIMALLGVCVLRLAQMQLVENPRLDEKIENLKLQRSKSLKTARGRILDSKGNILATDEPYFELHVDYQLTCWADERVIKAVMLEAADKDDAHSAIAKATQRIDKKQTYLRQTFKKIESFGLKHDQAVEIIEKKNNGIWNLREHLAWKRNFPDSNSFESAVSDEDKRLRLTAEVDIAEMHKSYPLMKFQSEDDIFTAQIEFANAEGVYIVPRSRRIYPFGSAACQTIGWIGPEQEKELFSDDPLARYLEGELSGRGPGVEYVCETILRGKRGKLTYDIDQELVEKKHTRLGQDVTLSIDIELQNQIEQYVLDCQTNSNCESSTAVVVIEVASGNILALVSTPIYNLNSIRYEYGDLLADKREPLRNRALNAHYPPGSVTKPLILIAGLESGKISASEVISCPAAPAPEGWPNCWIFNKHRVGHDGLWSNTARNAIRGSCNIYFSRLANRLEPNVLQQWLFAFGYGHKIALEPDEVVRRFLQVPGIISSENPRGGIKNLEDIPPLNKGELRYFGMGQGNFRVTPLQVANAMATIAREGLYKEPKLILKPAVGDTMSVSLNITPYVLSVVHDGMFAVVNESGGTAHKEFQSMLDYFAQAGVKVYGKTGSTENPDHAWFGGFAKDKTGRSIAIVVLVEGGQHGADDAAPLARDTIQFCIENGYLGAIVEYIE
jgi:penicillin-binding protein 2